MKKLKIPGLLILTMFFSMSVQAAAPDVISSDGNVTHFIKVTTQQDQRRFQLCVKGGESEPIQLGLKTWYTIQSLEHQRTIEQWEAAGSVVGATAIGVAAFFGGAVAGFAIVPTTISIAAQNLLGGALVGTVTVGTTGGFSLSNLGPVEQFKQQYLLRDDVINGNTVVVEGASEEEILKIAARLQVVLDKIN